MLDWLKDKLFTRSINNPSASLDTVAYNFGSTTGTGISVTPETALKHSAVYACVRLISQSIAGLPLDLYRIDKDGNTTPATDHPIYKLIKYKGSTRCTPYILRSILQTTLSLRGNAYAQIIRDYKYRPIDILPLTGSVTPTLVNGALYYKHISTEGASKVLASEDVIHLLSMSEDGITGKSAVTVARETISSGLAAVAYGAQVYKNGAHIKGVLLHPSKLTEDQVNSLKNTWRQNYSGIDNAGRIPVLEAGMKFEPISLTPQDSQFLASQKMGIEDIARIFGVPAHMIGALDKATFNNIEHQSLEYVVHTLRPLAKMWEQELDRKLLRTDELGEYFFRFNLDGLMRGDTKSRAEYYRALFNVGALSPNDIRRLENMNTVEGGDAYFVPLNMHDTQQPAPDAEGQKDTDNEQQQEGRNA
jgi:HK97 family phage portal protein